MWFPESKVTVSRDVNVMISSLTQPSIERDAGDDVINPFRSDAAGRIATPRNYSTGTSFIHYLS